MNDCINCYNNGLNKIDQKSDSVDVILVLSEAYEADSAKIIRKYNLRGITKHIVWSDSLLSILTHGGRSVIAFSSKYHNLIFRYDLRGLPDYLFDYLNRAGKPMDTLFPAYPNVALGASILNPFYVNQNKVYFINKVSDKVQGYDLLSGKRIFDFSIPDSILKKTFAYSGNPSVQCKMQHEILQQAHMAPYEINALVFNADTISILFTNYYFTVEEDSTLMKDNVNVIEVVKSKVVKTRHFPISFNNKSDQNKEYWLNTRSMHYQDSDLYSFIYSLPDPGQPYDYYVMGSFKPDKSGSFVLDKLSPIKNPQLYNHSMSCIFPTLHQGYFAFPLIDTLFPFSDKQSPISLGIIPDQYKFATPDERCDNGIFIDAFYITDDYVWVAYSNNTLNYETVVRHNRHTGKNQFSSKKISFGNFIYTNFDPINPDYLLFTLSGKNGILYRTKMF